jgi:hypothetical protein
MFNCSGGRGGPGCGARLHVLGHGPKSEDLAYRYYQCPSCLRNYKSVEVFLGQTGRLMQAKQFNALVKRRKNVSKG